MAMFDDVDKKLSGWFNAGAEKAKGMSETLRLSNAIREEETKQAELYRQMGKYFYDYFAVAAEGKMKEWCDGVKASQQQVQVFWFCILQCVWNENRTQSAQSQCGTNLPGMWCFCSGKCSVLYFLWN